VAVGALVTVLAVAAYIQLVPEDTRAPNIQQLQGRVNLCTVSLIVTFLNAKLKIVKLFLTRSFKSIVKSCFSGYFGKVFLT
jgi:hypothetical protein